jgi:hypothetical protein
VQAHLKTAPAITHPKFLNKLSLSYRKKEKPSLKKQNFLPSTLPTHIPANFATDAFHSKKKERLGV